MNSTRWWRLTWILVWHVPNKGALFGKFILRKSYEFKPICINVTQTPNCDPRHRKITALVHDRFPLWPIFGPFFSSFKNWAMFSSSRDSSKVPKGGASWDGLGCLEGDTECGWGVNVGELVEEVPTVLLIKNAIFPFYIDNTDTNANKHC